MRAAEAGESWEDSRKAGGEIRGLTANLSLFIQRDTIIRLLQNGILLDHLVLSEFVITEKYFES